MSATMTSLKEQYLAAKAKNLALDMTRGKPGSDQLDLSLPMLDLVSSKDFKSSKGEDPRNYGGLDGLPEMKALFQQFLEVDDAKEVIIGGASSLTLMHDTIARFMSHGTADSDQAWSKLDQVKFICPAPGYDRHFAICEHFGIDMITSQLIDGALNMDEIES